MSEIDRLLGRVRNPRASTHDWEPGTRKHMPVLLCRRMGCPIVWWPDRLEPKGECTGRHLVTDAPLPRWGTDA